MKEPIRHHYIPQFILRNFANDEGKVNYYDKKTKIATVVDTRDVFMSKNLYRDEVNHSNNPIKIEKDLSKFENEISKILKHFQAEREITITQEEDDKLKLFFAIMAFRSQTTYDMFHKMLSKESKQFYSKWQPNGNFSDLWKRNLGYIVNCRSLAEALENPNIDEPFKVFMTRDVFGYFGQYFCVAETSDDTHFIIGNTYPVDITGIQDSGMQLRMYSILPFSPNRVILLASNGVEGTPRDVLEMRPLVFGQPKINEKEKTMIIRVKKLCLDETQVINCYIEKESKEGFIFKL
jgi:hypothetical protein